MKIEKVVSDNKIKGVVGGGKGYFDGKVYDLDIQDIISIRYKVYNLIDIVYHWNEFVISTNKDTDIIGPYVQIWNYKKVSDELRRINPDIKDEGINYSIIMITVIAVILSMIFFLLIRNLF